MPIYLGDDKIGSVHFGTVGAGSTPISLATPSLSLNSSTGVVTATVTQSSSGYVLAGSTSDSLRLSTQAAASITPTSSQQTAVAAGKYTLGAITVAAIPTETKSITTNGTHTPSTGKYFSSVTVNVPVGSTISNQDKTVSPTENSQSITFDSGYTGLGIVTVNAISSSYVGSGISRLTSTDLTSSGATVTVPAGYYATNASKSVATTTHPNPGISVDSLTGLITASHTQTAGYVSAGTTTETSQLSVQAGATITPTTLEQTAVTAGKYTLGAIKVAAISTETKNITANGTYVPTSGSYFSSVTVDVDTGSGVTINNQNKSVNPTTSQQSITADSGYTGLGTVTVNAIPTETKSNINPTTSSQTILPTSGKYLTSVQINAMPSGTAGTPIATKGTVSGHSISITPSVTNTTGYIVGSTKTGTAVTVDASELVSGSETKTVNGTYDVTNLAELVVDVPTGSTISNQNKTVTPTESSQSITADSGYTGLGTVTVNAISNDYVGSGITRRSSTDLTVSDNTVTAPAGYYAAAASKSIAASSLTNSIINGSSFEETTGDYGFRVSVSIPEGYHNSGTITKDFSSILPAPLSEGTAAQVLIGYDLYNHDGQLISGTMTNNGTWNRTLDQTTTSVTIPAGYHSGSGTVSHTTVNIPDPTISVSGTGLITASGSWTRGFTTDNSYSATEQLTTQAAKTVTPTESEQTAVASGVYTTGIVKVGAIDSEYVGSDVPRRTSSNLTAASYSYSSNEVYDYVTCNVNYESGYYATGGLKGFTQIIANIPNIPKQAATTITPTTSTQTIAGRKWLTGDITINPIPSGYIVPTGNLEITSNGTGIDVAQYATVDVAVSAPSVSAQAKTGIDPSTSSQTITPDNGYDYLSSVQINAMPTMTLPTSASSSATSGYTSKATISRSTSDQYINIPTGYNSAGAYYKINAVANGSATNSGGASGTSATITTGTNTITLTKTVSITPTVTAGYISSGTAGDVSVALTASVTTNPTPTASGKTVTIPAGYYTAQTTKDVSTMTLPTSASASATSGYTSKATISRSTSDQYINIPTGYNTAGAYYKISAVANGSVTAPNSISGSSATVSTGTNTITLTKTVSVTPNVTTAGYISSGTAGNSSVSLTASVTTKSAATITPGTTNQTIAAGTYLTGAQTISGDANLVGSNIISGKSIFGVAGTVTFSTIHTGSSAPSSSVGSNGDVYLVLVS